MNRYPLARYHFKTGVMRKVMSAEEEADLGPGWGERQIDIRYPKNPLPLPEIKRDPLTFSVKLPGAS
jgi:hypothetical protein